MKIRKPIPLKLVVVAVLVITLIGTQVERFITQGTLFGYQVRVIKQTTLFGERGERPSEACKRVDAQFVSDTLGAPVERIGVNFGDQEKPLPLSTCSYRTKQVPTRHVTLVLRDVKDEAAATRQLEAVGRRDGSEEIKGLGDQAYFSSKSRQLTTRRGKQIATVTVSESTSSQISSKDAAVKLAEQLIK